MRASTALKSLTKTSAPVSPSKGARLPVKKQPPTAKNRSGKSQAVLPKALEAEEKTQEKAQAPKH